MDCFLRSLLHIKPIIGTAKGFDLTAERLTTAADVEHARRPRNPPAMLVD
jgi:hypothetical protein